MEGNGTLNQKTQNHRNNHNAVYSADRAFDWKRSLDFLVKKHILQTVLSWGNEQLIEEISEVSGFLDEVDQSAGIVEQRLRGSGDSKAEQYFWRCIQEFGMPHVYTMLLIWSIAPYLSEDIKSAYSIIDEYGKGYLTEKLAVRLYDANYGEEDAAGSIHHLRYWKYSPACFRFAGVSEENRMILPGEILLSLFEWGDEEIFRLIDGLSIEFLKYPEQNAGKGTEYDISFTIKKYEQREYQILWDAFVENKKACLMGAAGSGKHTLFRYILREMGKPAVWVDYQIYRNHDSVWPVILAEKLLGGTVIVEYMDSGSEEELAGFETWMKALSEDCHPSVLIHTGRVLRLSSMRNEWMAVFMTDLGASWRKCFFQTQLSQGVLSDHELQMLADRYRLNAGQVKAAIAYGQNLTEGDTLFQKLKEGCLAQMDHSLEKYAKRITPVFDMDDLVLPPFQKSQLKEAADQVRYHELVMEQWGMGKKCPYGQGTSVLMSGAPGTGKTMAAQVIAGILGLDLYRIELACIVSKYVGETERNLQAIFDAAGRTQGVLFFDEADVLFSKRTEVKEANDKYSNIICSRFWVRNTDYLIRMSVTPTC